MKTIKLTETDINRLVKKVLREQESPNYMFFSNLKQIHRQCEILLKKNEAILSSSNKLIKAQRSLNKISQ